MELLLFRTTYLRHPRNLTRGPGLPETTFWDCLGPEVVHHFEKWKYFDLDHTKISNYDDIEVVTLSKARFESNPCHVFSWSSHLWFPYDSKPLVEHLSNPWSGARRAPGPGPLEWSHSRCPWGTHVVVGETKRHKFEIHVLPCASKKARQYLTHTHIHLLKIIQNIFWRRVKLPVLRPTSSSALRFCPLQRWELSGCLSFSLPPAHPCPNKPKKLQKPESADFATKGEAQRFAEDHVSVDQDLTARAAPGGGPRVSERKKRFLVWYMYCALYSSIAYFYKLSKYI